MKPGKQLIGSAGILAAMLCLVVLTWIGTVHAIRAQRTENMERVQTTLSNQALTFGEQINRQLLALDQTLRFMVTAWESEPSSFELNAWRNQAVSLNGLSRDIIQADEHGIIRQSSVPDRIGHSVADQDFFRALAPQPDPSDRMFVGAATINPTLREWHMNVARTLHHPDGRFAGVIAVDYRVSALTDMFQRSELKPGAVVMVVGLVDGRLRDTVAPQAVDPETDIAGTPMFAAIQRSNAGIWLGPSPTDLATRIHSFRRLPIWNLAIVVARVEQEALHPAAIWQRDADAFAGSITALLITMALLLIQGGRLARKREVLLAEERAVLASANAQLEVARGIAAAKAEQLAATLGGMTDGVSMFDSQLRLVEWNDRFPEVAGVPADILRVGLPMEDILRVQIKGGQFGRIDDPDVEIARRVARLRNGPSPLSQRQRPDGHTLELRRKMLPEGGFVTLYSDVTEHKRSERALREARAVAEAATATKSHFVAIVSHEIRTPLNALLNTLRLLADSVLAPGQRSLLATARQSGDALFGLVNDILEMSQIEAGKLIIRPSLFDLRRLLESSVEVFDGQAAERGIFLRIAVAPEVPAILLTDPGRVRQVLLNLVSNAVKYAVTGEVRVEAEPGHDEGEAVRLLVRDRGPVIDAAARACLFQPFSRLDQPHGEGPLGSGLGLAICRELATLLGGAIGCTPWCDKDGQQGNLFWLSLPASTVPAQLPAAPLPAPPAAADALIQRRPPRTRILLVEDVASSRIVTATLLRREGHEVDTAASGQAAIEAAARTLYDAVLMDIFMPGMGGLEATAAIRALPGPAGAVPIIALTAHVSDGDAALFRVSGMNAILGKPISLADMLDTLKALVWSGTPGASPSVGPVRSPMVEAPVGQLASTNRWQAAQRGARGTGSKMEAAHAASPVLAADRILELRSNLPPQTLVSLVEECLVDLDERMPVLWRAVSGGSTSAITAHAHAMVGMAAGYGMAALERSLRAIMSAARANDMAALGAAAMTRVEDDLSAAKRALREMLQDVIA